jgi:hypothetical protein
MKNLKTIYNFQDQGLFQPDDHLLVELSDTGFSVMRYNLHNMSIIGLSVYQFLSVPDFSFKECYLPYASGVPFGQVHFYSADAQSTFMPADLHQAVLNQSILELTFGDQTYRSVNQDDLPDVQMVNVFSIPKAYIKWIQEDVSDFSTFTHTSSIVINERIAHDGIHIHFFYNRFNVTVCSGKKILLCTHFLNHGEEAFLFQMTNICHQLDLDPRSIPLHFSGLLMPEDAIIQLLQDYFGKIHFSSHKDWKLPHEENVAFPGHFFSHLITLATCG